MDLSKFLAKVMGLYLIIVSAAMLVNVGRFYILIFSLIKDAPLMLVTGYFAVIIGVMLVVSHSIWVWNWRVIITIISWIALLKGMCILICPQFINETTLHFVQNVSHAYMAGGVDLILGMLLIYFGFRRAA